LLEIDELAVDVSSTSLWRAAPVLDTLKVEPAAHRAHA
jgi:hypothetical protein